MRTWALLPVILALAACDGDGQRARHATSETGDSGSAAHDTTTADGAAGDAPTTSHAVPDGWDPTADAGEVTPEMCDALCDWVVTTPDNDVGVCASTCAPTCRALVEVAAAPTCTVSVGELASCTRTLRDPTCDDLSRVSQVARTAACAPITRCTYADDGAIDGLDFIQRMNVCGAIVNAAVAPGSACTPEWMRSFDACTVRLSGWGCEPARGTADEALPTVGELLACANAAEADDCDDSCRWPDVAAPAGTTPLAALSCHEARLACADALPDVQLGTARYPTCPPSTRADRPYNAPRETCVAALGELRCACAANPDATGCDIDVDGLDACITGSTVEACPLVGGDGCLTEPVSAGAAFAPDTPVADADAETLETWCAWRTCYGGGPGFTPSGCTQNVDAATVPTRDGCVDDLRRTFGPCADVTLADVHACVAGMSDADACHRLGRFQACASDQSWAPCHLVGRATGCEAVNACLADVWGVALGERP